MKNILFIIIVVFTLFAIGCQKSFLDKKQNKSLAIPVNARDLQSMLDNTSVFNNQVSPSLGEISSDDYFITEESWNTLTRKTIRNAYIWLANIYDGEEHDNDWAYAYQQILYANTVIENANEIDKDFQNVYGSALFYRSWAYFQLSQLFCGEYDPATAASDLGLPLRLEQDVTIKSERSTIQTLYSQIINDLNSSLLYLPDLPDVKTRPSKAAVFALLARIYLQMRDYENSLYHANLFLGIKNNLIDYNEINVNLSFPFPRFNEEVVFHTTQLPEQIFQQTRLIVDTTLISTYAENDIRKEAFFSELGNSGYYTFKGSYDGTRFLFSGITTSEVILISAECKARLNNLEGAAGDINYLLKNRFRRDSFDNSIVLQKSNILKEILSERRKELVFRGIRWSDLRRLNHEEQFSKNLYRRLGDDTFVLEPNSPKYVFQFPIEVIRLTGMTDNERN